MSFSDLALQKIAYPGIMNLIDVVTSETPDADDGSFLLEWTSEPDAELKDILLSEPNANPAFESDTLWFAKDAVDRTFSTSASPEGKMRSAVYTESDLHQMAIPVPADPIGRLAVAECPYGTSTAAFEQTAKDSSFPRRAVSRLSDVPINITASDTSKPVEAGIVSPTTSKEEMLRNVPSNPRIETADDIDIKQAPVTERRPADERDNNFLPKATSQGEVAIKPIAGTQIVLQSEAYGVVDETVAALTSRTDQSNLTKNEPKASVLLATAPWTHGKEVVAAFNDTEIGAKKSELRTPQENRMASLPADLGWESLAFKNSALPEKDFGTHTNAGRIIESFLPNASSVSERSEIPLGISFEDVSSRAPGAAQAATTLKAGPGQHPVALQQILVQIATTKDSSQSTEIELRLDPEELGKIRINLLPRDTGLVITMAVERPETLDLLRRHADDLMQGLRQMDLDGASLEFSSGGDEKDSTETGHDGPEWTSTDAVHEPATKSMLVLENDRLDIRF